MSIIIIIIIREAKGLRYRVLVHGQSADIPPAAGGAEQGGRTGSEQVNA